MVIIQTQVISQGQGKVFRVRIFEKGLTAVVSVKKLNPQFKRANKW